MQMDRRTQVDHLEMQKRKEASEKLSAKTPDGAFTDDPRADSYDKNGKARSKPAYDFSNGGMDLGRYPPNE